MKNIKLDKTKFNLENHPFHDELVAITEKALEKHEPKNILEAYALIAILQAPIKTAIYIYVVNKCYEKWTGGKRK